MMALQEGDRFLQTANACRFWPTGRGIFHNTAKVGRRGVIRQTFLVWCGEEDHLRIISMEVAAPSLPTSQMGGNVGQVFSRLAEGVAKIEAKIPFSSDERLGMLTFCPTNLGTTIRARSVPVERSCVISQVFLNCFFAITQPLFDTFILLLNIGYFPVFM